MPSNARIFIKLAEHICLILYFVRKIYNFFIFYFIIIIFFFFGGGGGIIGLYDNLRNQKDILKGFEQAGITEAICTLVFLSWAFQCYTHFFYKKLSSTPSAKLP